MVKQQKTNPFSKEQDHYRDSGVSSFVNIAKHPLHPAIVTFPIGLLTSTLGTDVAYIFTKDLFWARSSQWLLVAGLLSGLIAAITGMIDFKRIKRVRLHYAGWLHMIFNVVALVLTSVNLLLRLNNTEQFIIPWGLILSLIVASLLGASGWFGGELAFRHKIGVIGASLPED